MKFHGSRAVVTLPHQAQRRAAKKPGKGDRGPSECQTLKHLSHSSQFPPSSLLLHNISLHLPPLSSSSLSSLHKIKIRFFKYLICHPVWQNKCSLSGDKLDRLSRAILWTHRRPCSSIQTHCLSVNGLCITSFAPNESVLQTPHLWNESLTSACLPFFFLKKDFLGCWHSNSLSSPVNIYIKPSGMFF